jgi:hypothetical protein
MIYFVLLEKIDQIKNIFKSGFFKQKFFKFLFLLLLILISFLLLPVNFLSYKGGASLPFNINGLIDLGICRMILYPFVVTFYKSMNDFYSIFLISILLFFILKEIFKEKISIFIKSDSFIFLVVFMIYFSSTLLMRNGFTTWYGNYDNTFPNRYFYGINICFLSFIFIHFLHQKFIKLILISFFFISVILFSSKIFELNTPKYKYEKYGSMQNMICNSFNNKIDEKIEYINKNVLVPIYPVNHEFLWMFKVTEGEFKNMIQACE